MIRNPIAWKLFNQVSTAAQEGIFGTYYRSRRFSSDSTNPSPADLGPAPLGKQGEGRYTEGKRPVLYLSRTHETAAIESETNPSKPRVFIQKFELSLPDARVLHLTKDLEERYPYVHYLLLDSEYLLGEASFVPNPYRATQFVAFLCRLRGISAVEYPSVRGNYGDNPNAVNMVIFGEAVDKAAKMTIGSPFEFPYS